MCALDLSVVQSFVAVPADHCGGIVSDYPRDARDWGESLTLCISCC